MHSRFQECTYILLTQGLDNQVLTTNSIVIRTLQLISIHVRTMIVNINVHCKLATICQSKSHTTRETTHANMYQVTVRNVCKYSLNIYTHIYVNLIITTLLTHQGYIYVFIAANQAEKKYESSLASKQTGRTTSIPV